MKKYNREKKKWVSVEEYERTHQSQDKTFCKGKRLHDFVLVLPDYIGFTPAYKFNPEMYYAIMDEQHDIIEKQNKRLEAMGIHPKYHWNRKETRMYMCSVCKKKKYE